MRKVIVTTGAVEDFFARSREIAQRLDQRKTLQPEYSLTFEDPADMFSVLSSACIELFRAVKKEPASITDLAQRLQRDCRSRRLEISLK